MLSLFPELFTYALLGPLVLRVFVGVALLFLGYRRLVRRADSGSAAGGAPTGNTSSLRIALAGAELVVGLGLIVGIYLQAAAIAGALLALLYLLFSPRSFPSLEGGVAKTALLIICLSLLVLGPGAFAYDWPL